MIHSLRLLALTLVLGLASGCGGNMVSEADCRANGGQPYEDGGQVVCGCATDACCAAFDNSSDVRGCGGPEAIQESDIASPMADSLATPAR
ncbi:MAG: hypothetical protein Rubg2KO_11260 [Rubricoccaceae bacterium]